ncbi:hypothetical protein ACFQ45_17475 [Rhodanobacter aciditrophus]|uniref:Uncharacterized protein n=1 Tax=Rhodanobacter aciditrophus TaxID=1623218 RepID=A0ABW4B6F9_9GAMM
MKEKLKSIWANQKKPIMVILLGLSGAIGVPAWLGTPASSIAYSSICTVFEIECD